MKYRKTKQKKHQQIFKLLIFKTSDLLRFHLLKYTSLSIVYLLGLLVLQSWEDLYITWIGDAIANADIEKIEPCVKGSVGVSRLQERLYRSMLGNTRF